MMILSIVTGTYNRIEHLQRMIDSVRSSIGVGIEYEIVLVDGGSRDGTIPWAKEQKDVVLIEQGKLLGAVKAFNAGFSIARGEYVIIGNDDITFVDESITTALTFMENNHNVGIGCFYQDRNELPWHIERMGAVKNGEQISVPYGQVCIIPKWLGDKVGWWGNDYHTYAGDNELSCHVWELGYEVVAIPCACIHDYVAQDELRQKNANNLTPAKVHADSQKWVNKWKRKGLLGPILPKTFKNRAFVRRQRVLYAPIYERGHTLQHSTKRGLREALTKADYLVYEVDYIAKPLMIFDAASAFEPDIIITQFHDASIYTPSLVSELKKENPNAILVNWNGDYFPENFFNKEYMRMLKMYDLSTFVTRDVDKKYDKAGIAWEYWQIGFEESNAIPDKTTRRHDVVFLGNGHYDFRMKLGEVLRGIEGVDVGLYGTWPKKFKPDGSNLYNYDAGQKLYAAAKISISDGRPGTRFVSNRIFQSMYAGCFTIQQWFPEIYEMLEYDEGVHFVTYNEADELPELIKYWLKHDNLRKEIALAGQRQTLARHSFDVRVKQLEVMLQELVYA